MTRKYIVFLLFKILWAVSLVKTQKNPYSLQAAVDALRHREAQLALREFETGRMLSPNEPPSNYYTNEEPSDLTELRKQQELNKLVARYLENDDENQRVQSPTNYETEFDEDQYLDERKRSMFRERGETPYQSVFRERGGELNQPDLTTEFLKEMEREEDAAREEKYKETLRRLWEKYQQQENEIEEDLFDDDQQQQQQQQRGLPPPPPPPIIATHPVRLQSIHNVAPMLSQMPPPQNPYYGVVEKRRMLLPWLPATRRKRFPVTKRSPKYTKEEANISGTDEKVAKDLQAIFDSPINEKKKRSSGMDHSGDGHMAHYTPTTTSKPHRIEKKSDHSINGKPDGITDSAVGLTTTTTTTGMENRKYKSHEHDHNTNHDLDHDGDLDEQHNQNHRDHHERDHDQDHEKEHEHDRDEDEGDADDDEFDDEDEEDDRKKKRAVIEGKQKLEQQQQQQVVRRTVSSNPEILKEDQIIPGDLTDFKSKKSIQWNKYFGIDRRKKSLSIANTPNRDDPFDEYEPKHFRNHDQLVVRSNLDLNDKKLENMDLKLKTIEDLIIDETIKYTGAHEGITNPEEIQVLKNHVISRLATAYSLEKMRKALEKLKQSVDNERHLMANEIEESDLSNEKQESNNYDKNKRVAIKKEKVQFDNNHHTLESATEKVADLSHNNNNHGLDSLEEDKKKKKSLNHLLINQQPQRVYSPAVNEYNNEIDEFDDEVGAGHFEPMSESYMGGNSQLSIEPISQCPMLDAMEKRCRAIDLLSGDVHQEFLSICGIHQMCYLCGTSQMACDFQYLSDADSVCGHNKECQSSARSALMILRGSPGPQLGPHECSKNSCLLRAMRDIDAA